MSSCSTKCQLSMIGLFTISTMWIMTLDPKSQTLILGGIITREHFVIVCLLATMAWLFAKDRFINKDKK